MRWYLRYPLSYQDVINLLAERGVAVDRSTVYRWVQKFGPELTKRTEKYLRQAVSTGTCPRGRSLRDRMPENRRNLHSRWGEMAVIHCPACD